MEALVSATWTDGMFRPPVCQGRENDQLHAERFQSAFKKILDSEYPPQFRALKFAIWAVWRLNLISLAACSNRLLPSSAPCSLLLPRFLSLPESVRTNKDANGRQTLILGHERSSKATHRYSRASCHELFGVNAAINRQNKPPRFCSFPPAVYPLLPEIVFDSQVMMLIKTINFLPVGLSMYAAY